MKRRVYDLVILTGENAGCYRMTGIKSRETAERLEKEFNEKYADKCVMVDSTEDIPENEIFVAELMGIKLQGEIIDD